MDKNERSFKAEFDTIKKGLTESIERAFPIETVMRVECSDLMIYTKLMFVTLRVFKAKFCPPEALNIPVVAMPGFGGSDDSMQGVLFQREGFPKKLPHFIVRLSASRTLELQRMIINASDIRRVGQARETWDVRCQQEVTSRLVALRAGQKQHSSALAPTFSMVMDKFQADQDSKKAADNQRETQQLRADQARQAGTSVAGVQRLVRGEFDDEVGGYAVGPKGKVAPRARGHGRGRSTARVRERGPGQTFARLTSPSRSGPAAKRQRVVTPAKGDTEGVFSTGCILAP